MAECNQLHLLTSTALNYRYTGIFTSYTYFTFIFHLCQPGILQMKIFKIKDYDVQANIVQNILFNSLDNLWTLSWTTCLSSDEDLLRMV